jgi:hypothetical protein
MVVAGTMAAVLAASIAGAVKLPAPGTPSQVAKLVATSHTITSLSAKLRGQVANAANDNPGKVYPTTENGCTNPSACVFGDAKAAKAIVLFGDSHAQMWLPAVNRIAAAHKLKLILLFMPQCPAATLNVWLPNYDTSYTACSATRRAWIADLNKSHPLTILLADRTYNVRSAASGGTSTFTEAQWQAGMETTISTLRPSKAHIVVLGDITVLDQSVPSCLAADATSVQSCSVPNPNPARPSRVAAERAAAKVENVTYVDPAPWLCTKTCSPVIGGYIAYYDPFHISVTYDGFLSGVLQIALRKVL